MATRQPAVAGTFYEGDPDRLAAQVRACFAKTVTLRGENDSSEPSFLTPV